MQPCQETGSLCWSQKTKLVEVQNTVTQILDLFLQTGTVQIAAVKNYWNRMWCSCTATLWISVQPCDATVNQLFKVQLVTMGVTAEDFMSAVPFTSVGATVGFAPWTKLCASNFLPNCGLA